MNNKKIFNVIAALFVLLLSQLALASSPSFVTITVKNNSNHTINTYSDGYPVVNNQPIITPCPFNINNIAPHTQKSTFVYLNMPNQFGLTTAALLHLYVYSSDKHNVGSSIQGYLTAENDNEGIFLHLNPNSFYLVGGSIPLLVANPGYYNLTITIDSFK